MSKTTTTSVGVLSMLTLFRFAAFHPESLFIVGRNPSGTGDILRVDPETGSNISMPISSLLSNPIALDFDPVEQKLYWTEVGVLNQIRSTSPDGLAYIQTIRDAGTSVCSWFLMSKSTFIH